MIDTKRVTVLEGPVDSGSSELGTLLEENFSTPIIDPLVWSTFGSVSSLNGSLDVQINSGASSLTVFPAGSHIVTDLTFNAVPEGNQYYSGLVYFGAGSARPYALNFYIGSLNGAITHIVTGFGFDLAIPLNLCTLNGTTATIPALKVVPTADRLSIYVNETYVGDVGANMMFVPGTLSLTQSNSDVPITVSYDNVKVIGAQVLPAWKILANSPPPGINVIQGTVALDQDNHHPAEMVNYAIVRVFVDKSVNPIINGEKSLKLIKDTWRPTSHDDAANAFANGDVKQFQTLMKAYKQAYED